MDPTLADGTPPAPWFPRPRGDGPWTCCHDRIDGSVSPPTRGWTALCPRLHGLVCGFPAHAGMDPSLSQNDRCPLWFPRPRGDGPSNPVSFIRYPLVSPPTRGWTPTSRWRTHRQQGFPAHAGMDPMPSTRRLSTSQVSPPTRGWTAGKLNGRGQRVGFPAHAGMDPTTWRAWRGTQRFPRPRGDGPQVARTASPRRTVSPPTRGWTLLKQ